MKLVKLDKRHSLYQLGYTHALRFYSEYDPRAQRIRTKLRDLYGIDHKIWRTLCAKKHLYWIGVTDEKYLTLILLSLNN